VKFLFGIVAEILSGGGTGLHAVSAHDSSGRIVLEFVLNKKMFAEHIEMIGVQTGLIGTLQPLTHFDVEDSKTQSACGFAILNRICKAHPVPADFSMDRRTARSYGLRRE
jgi:hypothetical protein